ncbi:MAG: preprotein translocase subunit SecE [Rickettsiales bacterium]
MQIAKFIQEVKTEGIKKVTWPAPRESFNTSIMVLVMVVFFMIFFLIVDSVLFYAIQHVLDL